MRLFKSIYHFLGGIYFAIILIATVASCVIAGTFIESRTDSHRFAARLTYGNPVFGLLLWLFFVNILFAALRRWPFKYKHIPFLITHFGLLMILGGLLIKSYYGLQGSMGIMEGSAAQDIFLPDTYVVTVEKRDLKDPYKSVKRHYELPRKLIGSFTTNIKGLNSDPDFPDLSINLAAYDPNSKEKLDTWFKGGKVMITGIEPINVSGRDENMQKLPISARIRIPSEEIWDIIALHTGSIIEAAKQAYMQGLEIALTNNQTDKLIYKGLLKDFLKNPLDKGDLKAKAELHFNYSPLKGFESPELKCTFSFKGQKDNELVSIPLDRMDNLGGNSTISIDLNRRPLLLFIEDEQEDAFLFAFDPNGQVASESFRKGNLSTMIVYDRGFGGYAAQFKLPFPTYPQSNFDRHNALLHYLAIQLRQGLSNQNALSPPLQMIYEACQKANVDFIDCFLSFLSDWNKTQYWLYPQNRNLSAELSKVFDALDWKIVSVKDKQACQLISLLFSELEPQLKNGQDLLEFLKQRKWPLIEALSQVKMASEHNQTQELPLLLTALTQQIYSAVQQLDTESTIIPLKEDAQVNARLLSAYLQVYSIHLRNILPPMEENEVQHHLRVYHASRVFAQKVNQLLAPLDNWDIKQQKAIISSLPSNSATLQMIEDAYTAMLHQIGQDGKPGPIGQEHLATAYELFAPLSSIRNSPIGILEKQINAEKVCLECPITARRIGRPSEQKLEDNCPKVTLSLSENGKKEYIALSYDPFGAGLGWPALEGKYLLRFQPKFHTIPYRLRLREARQINYPNSFQPYSFESDLIVSDLLKPDAAHLEKTISMNHVHETWDGYRFYLSSIAPSTPGSVKKVQIVVNHDPAKYFLTYPGAVILSLGIILLFWLRPYSKK